MRSTISDEDVKTDETDYNIWLIQTMLMHFIVWNILNMAFVEIFACLIIYILYIE